jgi:hypothetical protein
MVCFRYISANTLRKGVYYYYYGGDDDDDYDYDYDNVKVEKYAKGK